MAMCIYMRLYADIHPVLSLELPLRVSADLSFFSSDVLALKSESSRKICEQFYRFERLSYLAVPLSFFLIGRHPVKFFFDLLGFKFFF